MSYTKGKWRAKDGQIYPEETGKTLAIIPYFDKDNAEQADNARLIAAAPELLEACKALLHALLNETSVGVCGDIKKQATLLIAKAEGK